MSHNEQIRRIRELFVRQGNKMSAAFLQAIQDIQDEIVLERIADLIERHRFNDVANIINTQMVEAKMIPFLQVTHDTFVAGGLFAAEHAMASAQVALRFNISNPKTSAFLNRYSMDLISGVTNDAKRTINFVISEGLKAGDNPFTIARDVRDSIGLTPLQQQAVQNYRTALENLNSSALDRALRDRRFDSTTQSAIDAGNALTDEKIDRMVDRYQDRFLDYRAETIARTESTRAVSAGQKALYDQAIENGNIMESQVKRFWVTAEDEKVRDSHAVMPDINADGVGQNEPFMDGDGNELLFPSDPAAPPETTCNCRCSISIEVLAEPARARSDMPQAPEEAEMSEE